MAATEGCVRKKPLVSDSSIAPTNCLQEVIALDVVSSVDEISAPIALLPPNERHHIDRISGLGTPLGKDTSDSRSTPSAREGGGYSLERGSHTTAGYNKPLASKHIVRLSKKPRLGLDVESEPDTANRVAIGMDLDEINFADIDADVLGATGAVVPHHIPSGRTLWRETSLGQGLTDALQDLLEDNTLDFESSQNVLEVFDLVATEGLPRHSDSRSLTFKMNGTMQEYKNLDGTWVLYCKNFRVKDKHRVFLSDAVKIVAAEPETLGFKSRRESSSSAWS